MLHKKGQSVLRWAALEMRLRRGALRALFNVLYLDLLFVVRALLPTGDASNSRCRFVSGSHQEARQFIYMVGRMLYLFSNSKKEIL